MISKAVLCLVAFALPCSLAYGQDIPAVTSTPSFQGFQLPTELGTLHYALNFSEHMRTNYDDTGNNDWVTGISGDVGYLSLSETKPTSLTYSGGYLYNTINSGGVQSSVFQNLTIQQSFLTRAWNVTIADALNYLPDSPAGGLSGVPGTGDTGVNPPPVGTESGPDILSRTGQRISNSATLSVQRQLTGSTALQGEGAYYLLRFLTGESGGTDGESISAQGGVNHRIDALNKAEANYTYTHLSFDGEDTTLSIQKIAVGYTRQISRKLSAHAAVGPEFVSVAGSPLANFSVNFSVDSGITYTGQFTGFSAGYTHGVRAGSGVVQGTFADSISAQADRKLGEYMHVSGSGSYLRSSSIAGTTSQLAIQTVSTNVQLSRTVSRNFNVFLTYGLQHQDSSNLAATTSAFNGISQIVGFGITYSPRQLHVGHQ